MTAAIVLAASGALAQTSPAPAPATPPSTGTSGPTGSSNPAVSTGGNAPSTVNASGQAMMVSPSALERGANSFTEGQAKSRIEGAGLSNVTGLAKDEHGIWRGKAMKGSQSVTVGFDYKGNIGVE